MIKKIFLILILFFSVANFTWSANSDFTIRTQIGDDVIPPTTPTLLSIVPIASSQIDLVWSASTDNFLLGGYVLLRDGLPLATTTLTSFNDTGLDPETLYSYEVYAFDSSYNISTTSNILSTTTLPVVIIPPVVATSSAEESETAQATKSVLLKNITIKTSDSDANFKWETYGTARYTLRWGETQDYTGGFVTNDTYRTLHETVVDNLKSDTVYYYELIAYTPTGIIKVLKQDQFKTEAPERKVTPPNIVRFLADVQGNDVRLSWQLPKAVSVSAIKIVSSPLGYPADIYDGKIIYQGKGVDVIDKDVFKSKSVMYYTAFVIDSDGNISSGAIVAAYKATLASSVGSENNGIFTSSYPTTTASSTDIETVKEISLHDFAVSDINIYQKGDDYSFATERILLSYRDPFVISIPYEALPKHLKSIIVTILDPTNNHRSYSFLLKLNETRTAYEATIAPLNVLGVSRLQIEIFDFEKNLVGLYRKQLDFVVSKNLLEPDVIFPDKIISSAKSIVLMILGGLLFILFAVWWLWRRSKEKVEDN